MGKHAVITVEAPTPQIEKEETEKTNKSSTKNAVKFGKLDLDFTSQAHKMKSVGAKPPKLLQTKTMHAKLSTDAVPNSIKSSRRSHRSARASERDRRQSFNRHQINLPGMSPEAAL